MSCSSHVVSPAIGSSRLTCPNTVSSPSRLTSSYIPAPDSLCIWLYRPLKWRQNGDMNFLVLESGCNSGRKCNDRELTVDLSAVTGHAMR